MYRSAVLIWRSVSSVIPCIVLCLLYLLGTPNLAAQTPPTTPAQSDSDQRTEETTASPSQGEATLIIQNRMITVFRSRFFGRSPAVRVEGAQRQFREVINSRRAGTVTARTIPQGMQVSIGEEGIFTLTPDDLDQASEETMDQAAARAVNNLTIAYAETLELHDAKRMWEAVGLTVLATILLILSFWLLRRARRFAQARLVSAASKRIGDMGIGGFTLLTRERLLSSTRWLVNFLMWAIELVLIYLWLAYSLKRVHAMLLLAAERTPGLRKEPQPFVLQIKFSDFYVEYQLNAALERTEERLPVLTNLRSTIQDVFNEHGVELVSPHYITCPPENIRQAKETPSTNPRDKKRQSKFHPANES
jgi:Mechanosensitive ion channel